MIKIKRTTSDKGNFLIYTYKLWGIPIVKYAKEVPDISSKQLSTSEGVPLSVLESLKI